MSQKRPVFITGLPRSGTTWSSRALAATINGRIVNEPFNWRRFPQREKFHMRYIPVDDSNVEFVAIFRRAIHPWLPMPPFNRRPVVKDVHTCLAVEYISSVLQPLMVVVMRHPCAVALSWQALKLEAQTRLNLLLSQPRLVETYLRPFVDHMVAAHDYFSAVGTYWGATYYILHQMQNKHPHWCWITHEALCAEPLERFEQVITHLGLGFGPPQKRRLQSFLLENNRQGSNQDGVFAIKRITDQEPYKWRRKLSPAQIDSVLSGAEPFKLLPHFFPEDS